MNRLTLILIVVSSFLLTGGSLNDYASSSARLFDSSVMVKIGDRGCGSGVLVTVEVQPGVTKSYVWTAGHVVEALRNYDGSYENAIIYREQRVNGKVVGKSEVQAKVVVHDAGYDGTDLALLEILPSNYLPVYVSASFYLDDDIPGVGVEVCHIGCTVGFYNSYSEGLISQTDVTLDGLQYDQTTVMAFPGSSGGGVYLTDDGRCVGLLVQGVGPGLNWIVPVRQMISWAKDHEIEWAINSSIIRVI